MTLKDEVKIWTEDAFKTLERAKQLSSLAQAVLESTDHILRDQLPNRLHTAETLMNQVKNQHANITALVEHLRSKVQDSIIRTYTSAVDKQLVPALSGLDKALKLLDHTQVPLHLITDSETGVDSHKLSDFVSHDVIDKLRANISVHRNNCQKAIDLLESQLDNLLDTAHKNNTKFSRCTKIYDSQVVSVQMIMRYALAPVSLPRANSNIVKTILKENASLEQELVSLLEMLTNHYDQCVLAQSLLREEADSKMDYEVLHNDALELPSVLKEFGGIHDIIMNNESRAAKFVDQKLPHIEDVATQCEELILSYNRFKSEDVVQFVLLVLKCEEIFRQNSVDMKSVSGKHTVEIYSDVVNQLTYHYTQFHTIYQLKYLTELHYEQFVYPRKYLKLLNDFLNQNLLQIEEEERQRRHHWLQKYGNFIPKDFVLPGEYNQPTVVQVVSEGLDSIQSSTAQDEEDRLLELIKAHRNVRG